MRKGVVFGGLVFPLFFSVAAAAQSFPDAAPGSWSIGVEAMRWSFKDSPSPGPVASDGVIGEPGTHVLLGGKDFSTDSHPGARLGVAYQISERIGLEANAFSMASRSTSAGVASNAEWDSVQIFLPYIDASTGQEAATELSETFIYQGAVQETYQSKLHGAEVNARWALPMGGAFRMDLLGGLRYLHLDETYTLTTQSPYLPAFGSGIWDTTDRFASRNRFFGLQAGMRLRFDKGNFFADATAKVGVGAMKQTTDVDGKLVTDDFTFAAPETFVGGYFALPSNIGTHSRTEFAIVPEATLNLGYRITPAASINLGYSLLHANHVLRPGNQVNRTINPNQSVSWTEDPDMVPQGPALPDFHFKSSSFWAQGLHLGFTFRF